MRLFNFTPCEGLDGKVTAYLHDCLTEMQDYRENYPVVVVCPGGGYQFCSQREADPVVLEYFSKGYNVFLLNYSVKEKAQNFNPLKELSSTIMQIRENAKEWNCESDKIAVCGFSAGGHLAASIGTLWNDEKFLSVFDNKGGLNKPNALILGYPVISSGGYAHKGSIATVSGELQGEKNDYFSLENNVGKHTPPSFIWHTAEDNGVPVENAFLFAKSLRKFDIPFELHVFPFGGHGLSVCKRETGSKNTHVQQWLELSVNFLNLIFDYEY